MQKSLLLLLLLLIVLSIFFTKVVYAQNPLLRKSNEDQEERIKKNPYPSFVQKFIVSLSKFQKTLNEKLSELAREVKRTNNITVLFWLIFLSFLYGIIHALGPGHGKFLTLSYFLSENATARKGIIFGSSVAYLHALSGFIFVIILYAVIKGVSIHTTIDSVSRNIQTVSYGLIALVGCILLIKNIFFGNRREKAVDISKKSMISIILAVGIIPCPGSVILTLFSISIGSIFLGAMMVIAMATGMALTISLIGVLTIKVKGGTMALCRMKNDVQDKIASGMQILGSLLIFIVGMMLFLSHI